MLFPNLTYYDTTHSLEAELWAIYHGLSIAWGRGFKNLIIESNSANAIRLLYDECNGLHSRSHLIRGIQRIIVPPSDVRWKHDLREANQLADILAKESLDLLAPCKIHDIVPPSISVALLADRRGILFPSGF